MLHYNKKESEYTMEESKKLDGKKVLAFCSPFRIVIGLGLIGYAVYSGNPWFYLGVIPLIAGITKFCPLCQFTDKCDV